MKVEQEVKIKTKGLQPRFARAPRVSGLVKSVMEKLKDD
jgi:hypothetical protein